MHKKLTLNTLDKNHVLLDIGLVLTKCGLVTEPAPRHIVPTLLSPVKALRDSIVDQNASTFANLFKSKPDKIYEKQTLYLEVEEFLNQIIYHLLQIQDPRQKGFVIIESIMGLRPLYEAVGHCLFRSFGVRSVYFILGNVLPIYTSG